MLQSIISKYGIRLFWKRALSLETTVHIILEQQVSLSSSALAAT
jgi:hypothetical protein